MRSVLCYAIVHREHAKALSARQAVAQSRKSRGFFTFFKRVQPEYRPTYNHKPDGDACRIYGTLGVKKVTGEHASSDPYVVPTSSPLPANFHVTTLGHGYSSHVHVPHDSMSASCNVTHFSSCRCRDESFSCHHRVLLRVLFP